MNKYFIPFPGKVSLKKERQPLPKKNRLPVSKLYLLNRAGLRNLVQKLSLLISEAEIRLCFFFLGFYDETLLLIVRGKWLNCQENVETFSKFYFT